MQRKTSKFLEGNRVRSDKAEGLLPLEEMKGHFHLENFQPWVNPHLRKQSNSELRAINKYHKV